MKTYWWCYLAIGGGIVSAIASAFTDNWSAAFWASMTSIWAFYTLMANKA